jgi:hypothetical protein
MRCLLMHRGDTSTVRVAGSSRTYVSSFKGKAERFEAVAHAVSTRGRGENAR